MPDDVQENPFSFAENAKVGSRHPEKDLRACRQISANHDQGFRQRGLDVQRQSFCIRVGRRNHRADPQDARFHLADVRKHRLVFGAVGIDIVKFDVRHTVPAQVIDQRQAAQGRKVRGGGPDRRCHDQGFHGSLDGGAGTRTPNMGLVPPRSKNLLSTKSATTRIAPGTPLHAACPATLSHPPAVRHQRARRMRLIALLAREKTPSDFKRPFAASRRSWARTMSLMAANSLRKS